MGKEIKRVFASQVKLLFCLKYFLLQSLDFVHVCVQMRVCE